MNDLNYTDNQLIAVIEFLRCRALKLRDGRAGKMVYFKDFFLRVELFKKDGKETFQASIAMNQIGIIELIGLYSDAFTNKQIVNMIKLALKGFKNQ